MALSDIYASVVDSLKSMWAKFDLQGLSERIGGTSAEAVQAALYFGLFFATGFVFKKYFKFLFAVFLVSVLIIKILEYNAIATINWQSLQLLTGVNQLSDLNVFINNFFIWAKAHILLTVASVVGFLIGYKLG